VTSSLLVEDCEATMKGKIQNQQAQEFFEKPNSTPASNNNGRLRESYLLAASIPEPSRVLFSGVTSSYLLEKPYVKLIDARRWELQ
jgi:hypothetical protein